MIPYDIDSVYNFIRNLGNNVNDPIAGWGNKQDLYRIKELVDETIRTSPTFLLEPEWLTHREKQRIINILQSK
jgi:hypothetical protein